MYLQPKLYANYLGVLVGPGAVGHYWGEPIQKYLKVVETWTRLGLGMHWAAKIYRIYALSILSFYLGSSCRCCSQSC